MVSAYQTQMTLSPHFPKWLHDKHKPRFPDPALTSFFPPYLLENILLVTMGGALTQSGPPPEATNHPSAGENFSAPWLMQWLVLFISLIRLTSS